MLPTQLLDHLGASGVHLELRGGKLRAGPPAALTPGVRGLIAENRPALVLLLTAPRRLWLIVHADGARVSHSFAPPATYAEVRDWYPAALAIDPEPEPDPGHLPAGHLASLEPTLHLDATA